MYLTVQGNPRKKTAKKAAKKTTRKKTTRKAPAKRKATATRKKVTRRAPARKKTVTRKKATRRAPARRKSSTRKGTGRRVAQSAKKAVGKGIAISARAAGNYGKQVKANAPELVNTVATAGLTAGLAALGTGYALSKVKAAGDAAKVLKSQQTINLVAAIGSLGLGVIASPKAPRMALGLAAFGAFTFGKMLFGSIQFTNKAGVKKPISSLAQLQANVSNEGLRAFKKEVGTSGVGNAGRMVRNARGDVMVRGRDGRFRLVRRGSKGVSGPTLGQFADRQARGVNGPTFGQLARRGVGATFGQLLRN